MIGHYTHTWVCVPISGQYTFHNSSMISKFQEMQDLFSLANFVIPGLRPLFKACASQHAKSLNSGYVMPQYIYFSNLCNKQANATNAKC